MVPWHLIPEELFERIIRHLCYSGYKWARCKSQDLGGCALVNRYWASRIRPTIFESLCIKGRKRAQAFVALLKPRGHSSHFGAYIVTLSLEFYRADRLPWIHWIWNLRLQNTLPKLRNVWLSSRGTGASDPNFVRSLYYDNLPRTIPSIQTVFRHRLEDLHFRAFKDLLACINSLDCNYVRCKRVTWEDILQLPQDFRTFFPVHAGHKRIHTEVDIEVKHCRAVWPFIWCHISPRLYGQYTPQRLVYVHPDELNKLLLLVQYVCDNCGCRLCNLWKSKAPHRSPATYFLRYLGG